MPQGLIGRPFDPRAERPPVAARVRLKLTPDQISCRFHRTSMRQAHGARNSNDSKHSLPKVPLSRDEGPFLAAWQRPRLIKGAVPGMMLLMPAG